jgi:hypothetical protein
MRKGYREVALFNFRIKEVKSDEGIVTNFKGLKKGMDFSTFVYPQFFLKKSFVLFFHVSLISIKLKLRSYVWKRRI